MPSSTDCRPVRVGREMDREERGKKGSGLSQSHGDKDTEMEKETRRRDTERDEEEWCWDQRLSQEEREKPGRSVPQSWSIQYGSGDLILLALFISLINI